MAGTAALVVNFHREGRLAHVAATSAQMAVTTAREQGFDVDLVATLDRADDLTRSVVMNSGAQWGEILELDLGDLGLVRKSVAKQVSHDIVGFSDGDDLMGSEWLARALHMMASTPGDLVLHPEYLYYFSESDFQHYSGGVIPLPGVSSFFIRQVGSDHPTFDVNLLRFNHIFSSAVVTRRSLYERFPYRAVDAQRGLGVDDWTWNAVTIRAGVAHLVVPDTVHLVRDRLGSMSKTNGVEGIMPEITVAFPRN